MKKRTTAVLALGLALTMTACVPQNVPETRQAAAPDAVYAETEPLASSSTHPTDAIAAVQTETGETQVIAQATEEITAEGLEETVKLTQYDGQGYSIMIPDGLWRLESELDDGRPEQTWESIYNPEVELKVEWFAGLNKEQAQGFLMAEEDDFQLEIQTDGSMMGRDVKDGEILFARFYPGDAGTFVLTYSYPDTKEMEEGFGARLSAIANSFQLK